MSTDDKRALLSAEELAYARFAVNRLRDPEQDDWPLMSRILDRLLAEHDALKAELAQAIEDRNTEHSHCLEVWRTACAERDAALRDLAEAREQLAACRRERDALDDWSARDAVWHEVVAGTLRHAIAVSKHNTAECKAARFFDCVAGWEARTAALESAMALLASAAQQQPAPSERSAPTAVECDANAPLEVADLPAWWDARRARQGKPDASRCAAELRRAIEHEGIGALTAVVRELAPRVTEHPESEVADD